jgi:antitoxin HicB
VLLTYLKREMPLPKPRAKGRGLVEIAVALDVAAKLALLAAFAQAGVSKSELARRLGKNERRCAAFLIPMACRRLAFLRRSPRRCQPITLSVQIF